MLLRRVAFKTFKKEDDTKTVWAAAAENTKQQVKAALLEGYENETAVGVRNKLCDTIADIARDGQEENRMFFTLKLVDPGRRVARTVERALSEYKVS